MIEQVKGLTYPLKTFIGPDHEFMDGLVTGTCLLSSGMFWRLLTSAQAFDKVVFFNEVSRVFELCT